MGRQIEVSFKDLEEYGCTVEEIQEPNESWYKVSLPDGRFMGSDSDDCLIFDCRSRYTSGNGWMEDWLVECQVPYNAY